MGWKAHEAASERWGTTVRVIILMAAGLVFSGNLLGLIFFVADHHAAGLLLCHHSPGAVRRWLGVRC